jgi:high-affinity iron transporter
VPLRTSAPAVRVLVALVGAASIGACARAEAARDPCAWPPLSAAQHEDVRRVAGLLDYVAADYGAAVHGGEVLDGEEFEEQLALLAEARFRMARLPAGGGGVDLVAGLRRLRSLVVAKAAETVVAPEGRTLRRSLLGAYGVTLAPAEPLSLARGAALYVTRCAGCHGGGGAGDGPAGRGLRPPPRNLRDPEERASLTPARAFAAVTYGVRETAMPAFPVLTTSDRWNLAFFVLALGHDDEDARTRGRNAFARTGGRVAASATALAGASDASLLGALATAGLAAREARDALAFLRADAAFLGTDAALDPARRLLSAALAAYHADDPHGALRLVRALRGDAGRGRTRVLAARDAVLAARVDACADRLEASLVDEASADDVDQAGLALAGLYDLADERLADPQRARAALMGGLRVAAAGIGAVLLGLLALVVAARIVLSAPARPTWPRPASDAARSARPARSAPDRSASDG